MKYNCMIDALPEGNNPTLPDAAVLERITLFAAGHTFRLEKPRNQIAFFEMPPSLKYNASRLLAPRTITGFYDDVRKRLSAKG